MTGCTFTSNEHRYIIYIIYIYMNIYMYKEKGRERGREKKRVSAGRVLVQGMCRVAWHAGFPFGLAGVP